MKRKLSLYIVDTVEDIKIDEVTDDEDEVYFIEGSDHFYYLKYNKPPMRIVSRDLKGLIESMPD